MRNDQKIYFGREYTLLDLVLEFQEIVSNRKLPSDNSRNRKFKEIFDILKKSVEDYNMPGNKRPITFKGKISILEVRYFSQLTNGIIGRDSLDVADSIVDAFKVVINDLNVHGEDYIVEGISGELIVFTNERSRVVLEPGDFNQEVPSYIEDKMSEVFGIICYLMGYFFSLNTCNEDGKPPSNSCTRTKTRIMASKKRDSFQSIDDILENIEVVKGKCLNTMSAFQDIEAVLGRLVSNVPEGACEDVVAASQEPVSSAKQDSGTMEVEEDIIAVEEKIDDPKSTQSISFDETAQLHRGGSQVSKKIHTRDKTGTFAKRRARETTKRTFRNASKLGRDDRPSHGRGDRRR